jgi:hypothetical protein
VAAAAIIRTDPRGLIMTDLLGRSAGPRLEPWQDARRIPEQYSADAPATFEWWYFDAQLSGGRALVVAFVVEPDMANARYAYPHTDLPHASGWSALEDQPSNLR